MGEEKSQLVASLMTGVEDANEWLKMIQGSIAAAKGYTTEKNEKNDVIAYNTEEEAAALCLRYVDLEERILGWNSPKIRTLMMQEGNFEVRKQEESQVFFFYLFFFIYFFLFFYFFFLLCFGDVLLFWVLCCFILSSSLLPSS